MFGRAFVCFHLARVFDLTNPSSRGHKGKFIFTFTLRPFASRSYCMNVFIIYFNWLPRSSYLLVLYCALYLKLRSNTFNTISVFL